MIKTTSMKRRGAIAVAACALVVLPLAGCQSHDAATEADASGTEFATEAAAYEGEYDVYDPDSDAALTGGVAIEGSDEEELQQERIAGGAVNAVVSKNLEPLEGMTDYSEGEYSSDWGIYGQPPAECGNGADCATCHDPRTARAADGAKTVFMPTSHVDSDITEGDCASCHVRD